MHINREGVMKIMKVTNKGKIVIVSAQAINCIYRVIFYSFHDSYPLKAKPPEDIYTWLCANIDRTQEIIQYTTVPGAYKC